MTEIIVRPDKLRTDKTPSPRDVPAWERPWHRLTETGTREFLWLCPLDSCRRTVRMEYRPTEPLPCCMGGPRPHVKQMLVCDNYDVYVECFHRWMAKGEQLGKPTIYPRNYFRFPVLARGETMRDVGGITTGDRQ